MTAFRLLVVGALISLPVGRLAAEDVADAAKAQATPVANAPVAFDDFFVNKALRLELYQTGDAHDEAVTLRGIYEEPIWPGNTHFLIAPFELGRYAIKVYDAASDRLIYSKGFDTMFAEYRTTSPAIEGTKKVFQTSPRLPFPKKPARVSIERRDKQNVLSSINTLNIDPADYHIVRESADQGDWTFEVQKTGDPHDRVDLAFLSEGYTAADRGKFKADVERIGAFLFTVEPYKSCRDKFNVYGVFRRSAERGVDEPRQHSYKSTALGAGYNAFDLDRYLLTEENHAMHRMAAQVPYDTIVVLVNTPRYGGGSICLDYCIAGVDHSTSPRIFVHEFGHSFAYLADEYIGTVAYNDRYPAGVEPLEANITELLDPQHVKWQKWLTPGIALPTSTGKSELRAIEDELAATQKAAKEQIAAAQANGGAYDELMLTTDKLTAHAHEIQSRLDKEKAYVAEISGKVGAFEGAGYMAKGMYRPQLNCWMGTAGPNGAFCAVCQQAIRQMIDYYSADSISQSSPTPLLAYNPLPVVNADGLSTNPEPIHVEQISDALREEYRINLFYKKCTILNGIPIIGSENVSDYAFLECAWTLDHLLHGRTMAHDALVKSKVRVGIIAATEYTMDIPENQNPRMMASAAYNDRRSRGLGGLPLATCAEENLLNLRGDPYRRENITIHEFSHTVASAIRRQDRQWYERLRTAYNDAKARGDYGNSYAISNEQEYWAEGAQCWFDCADPRNAGGAGNHTQLKAKDEALAGLLTEVYGDTDFRYKKTADRSDSADTGHLIGLDRTKMPIFDYNNSPRIQAAAKPVEPAK